MRKAKLLALCTTCVLAACAGDGSGLDENGRPVGESSGGALQPNFKSIQDNVFTPICTVCHAGAAAPLGLRLDEGSSYALLVNAPSVEVPSLRRVEPGNPDASYLIQKLEGIAAVGGRMPLNQPALPQETIAVIRQWISDGAANNAAMGGSAKSRFELVKLTAISPARDEAVPAPVRDIIITSNVELDTSLLQSNLIELRSSGGDGNFDSGNEREAPVDATVRSDLPTVLAITPRVAPLAADSYELRIRGTDPVAMADMQAHPIDGDGDGTPGGDFVVRFTVEMAQ